MGCFESTWDDTLLFSFSIEELSTNETFEQHKLFLTRNIDRIWNTVGVSKNINVLLPKFNDNITSKSNYITASNTFSDYSDIDITTGASADIRQANNIVKKYLELFENYIVPESISDSTQNLIDTRISELIKECFQFTTYMYKCY